MRVILPPSSFTMPTSSTPRYAGPGCVADASTADGTGAPPLPCAAGVAGAPVPAGATGVPLPLSPVVGGGAATGSTVGLGFSAGSGLVLEASLPPLLQAAA